MKAIVLLFALLMPSLALAQAVTAVDVSDLKEGESLVVTKKAGVITVRPLLWAGNGPAPTPTPTPVPTDLTARAKAIQAEAIKVGDPTTAKTLAEVYRQIAKLGRDGTVKDQATLQAMTKYATDTTLGPVKAPAWQKTRDVLALQWSQVPAGSPVAAYSTLLEEAGSGLDAVDLLKAISPETLKWILEFLLPLLLKLFFPTM